MDGLSTLRNSQVVKGNQLIQHSRYQFSVTQQKILLYIVSQLDSVNQTGFVEQTFEIADFCRVAGFATGGRAYKDLKDAIIDIRNKGFWIKKDDGSEVTVSWINKAKVDVGKGTVVIRLDEDMVPFLLDLKANFTKYKLIYTLTMRSKYSLRLYELLKSFEGLGKANFELGYFRFLMDAAGYADWKGLKRRVIQPAVDEINELTDIVVQYTPVRGDGQSYVAVDFTITKKVGYELEIRTPMAIHSRIQNKPKRKQEPQIEGQMTLD